MLNTTERKKVRCISRNWTTIVGEHHYNIITCDVLGLNGSDNHLKMPKKKQEHEKKSKFSKQYRGLLKSNTENIKLREFLV